MEKGFYATDCDGESIMLKPRYKVDEIVYLKEPFYDYGNGVIWYAFDMDSHDRKKMGWQNKLFMPESSARYFIQITDIRIERLQNISNASIKAEGLRYEERFLLGKWVELWDKINGKNYSFNSNPFVWVYQYKITEQTKEALKNFTTVEPHSALFKNLKSDSKNA